MAQFLENGYEHFAHASVKDLIEYSIVLCFCGHLQLEQVSEGFCFIF